jgi:hypothetical protein
MLSLCVTAQSEASIHLSSETIDYGVIKKGTDGERTVTVSNRGNAPLVLSNCAGSCGCTVPTCPREPIMPNRSATISIKYDTNRSGPFSKMITIFSNDPQKTSAVVRITGEVKE